MGKKWILAPMILALAALLTHGRTLSADNITVDGSDEYSGGGGTVVTTGEDSTITNGTYFVQQDDEVYNLSGWKVDVNANGVVDVGIDATYTNQGTTNINATGRIDLAGDAAGFHNVANATTTVNSGGTLNISGDGAALINDGSFTFMTGGTLNIGVDGYAINTSNISFASGSIYQNAGTGNFINQGNLYVNTAATGAKDLIEGVSLSGNHSYMYISGATGNIAGQSFTNLSDSLGVATVVIQTDAGGSFTTVNVGHSKLWIDTDTTFTGRVDGGDMIVRSGTSTFQNAVVTDTALGSRSFTVNSGATADFNGANANLQAGSVVVQPTGNLYFQNGGKMTVATTGAVDNSGTIKFHANSEYVSSGMIVNNIGGGIHYNVDMTGLTGTAGAFANTNLKTNSDLYLEGNGTIADDLLLNSNLAAPDNVSELGSRVTVTDGLTFSGEVDVNNADLIVNGTGAATYFRSAVTAANITVNESKETVFEGAIQGNLIVNSTATMASTSSLTGHNVTVNTNGALNNNSATATGLTIAAGNTMKNHGTFNNNGVFINRTSTGGDIANETTGTMIFGSGTRYTASTGYSSLIHNYGEVEANVQMGNTNLMPLMRDMGLYDESEFTLVTGGAYTLSDAYGFGYTEAGANVNLKAGNYSFIFSDTGSLDAGEATLNILEGKTLLSNGVDVLKTEADIVVHDKGVLGFADGGGHTASIRAANLTVNSGGGIVVGETDNLTLNTTGGTGMLTLNGASTIDIAKEGSFTVNGRAAFNSGSVVTLAESAELRVSGNISFLENTTINITATADSISKIISTTGDIAISSGGATEVVFTGSAQDIIGKIFIHAEDGTVNDYDKLYNTLYKFGLDTSEGGEGVVVTGLKSVVDIMIDSFGGEEYMSINKYNGGEYTDQILLTDWGSNNSDLATYIQLASSDTISASDSFVAFSQLYGEYGAYSATSLMVANSNFKDMLHRRMNRFRTMTIDCNSCTTKKKACGKHSDVTVTSSGAALASGSRGGYWGGAFGDWARQKADKNIFGYDYNSGGAILGYDYATDCLTIGFAAAYTNGTLKVDKMNTKFDSDVASVGLYGVYNLANAYIRGYLSYGYGWNDYEVGMLLGGRKNGEYDNQSYSAGLELGYRAELPCDFVLVPSVGVDYTHISQEKWTETVHVSGNNPVIANHFDRDRFNSVEIPVGVRLSKVINMGDMALIPEVRGAFIYQANDRRDRVRTGYAGSGMSTTMYGVDCGPTRGMVGGGVRAVFSDCFDIAVDYSLNFKGGYRDHNLTGTLGLSF